MKIVSVVGARPQFIKVAPVDWAFRNSHEHLILHTGQHYDHGMSQAFFDEFNLSQPDANLAAGSGSHAKQTALIMTGVEEYLEATRPDWLFVYGDTNSTFASAIAAAKIGVPVVHIEAGLRSGNRGMPEEVNRILTDHSSDFCLAPTDTAMSFLRAEGLGARSVLVGDVTVEVLRKIQGEVADNPPNLPWDISERYILATLHRQALLANHEKLREVLIALGNSQVRVYLAAHPRLKKAIYDYGLEKSLPRSISTIQPLGYREAIWAVMNADGVVTDSGGLQKETYLLRKPCLTIRSETEWPETLAGGGNRLVWEDLTPLVNAEWVANSREFKADIFGDGATAHRIINLIENA